MRKNNQVQPSRLVRLATVSIRGHPLLRRVCTSVTNSVAFQAILDLRIYRQYYYLKSLPFGGSPMLITSEYVPEGGGPYFFTPIIVAYDGFMR